MMQPKTAQFHWVPLDITLTFGSISIKNSYGYPFNFGFLYVLTKSVALDSNFDLR